MKPKHLVNLSLWLLVAAIVVVYDACFPPTINVEQPQAAEENSTFTADAIIFSGGDQHGLDPEVQDFLTKIELELPFQARGTRADSNWIFFGIMLPQGWTVTDGIPFTGANTGTFHYNDTLTAEMEEYYPADTGYYWWVSRNIDPITVGSGSLEFYPEITTDDQAGTFWIDYTVGYDIGNGPSIRCNADVDNMIGVGLEEEVWVTTTTSTGPGSLRDAINLVMPGGDIYFDIPLPAVIALDEYLRIWKDVSIHGPGMDDLIVSGSNQSTVFSIDNGMKVSISGLEVANSSNSGIYCGEGSEVHFSSLKIRNNVRYGLELYADSAWIDNTKVSYNGDCGLYIYGGQFTEVTGCEIDNNNGSGIYTSAGLLLLSGSTIKDNITEFGGGIYINGDIYFDPYNPCSIYNNIADIGMDLYNNGSENIEVYLDFFTVTFPNSYFAYPHRSFTFNILNHIADQIEQDVYVSPDGSDENAGTSPGQAFGTIRHALMWTHGTELNPINIFLDEGTYSQDETSEVFPLLGVEYINLKGPETNFAIIQNSESSSGSEIFLLNHLDNMSLSNIDLQRQGYSPKYLIHAENSNLDLNNLLIHNNGGYNLFFRECGDLTFNNLDFQHNYYPSISLENSTASFTGTFIGYNVQKGLVATSSVIDLTDCEIADNVAEGVLAENCNLQFTDCEIMNNRDGLELINCDAVLANVDFSGNFQGIYCESSYLHLDSCIIAGSSSSGIQVSNDSELYVLNSQVFDNHSTLGGGIACYDESYLYISSTSIRDNEASLGGGGIYLDDESTISFSSSYRCNIYNNTAPRGSDLYTSNFSTGINVYVDTFSVIYPTSYYAYPRNQFWFSINHGLYDQYDQDLWVSPAGSDDNTGTSPEEPLLSITKAMKSIIFLEEPHSIHLAPGTYSSEETGEQFPILSQGGINIIGPEGSPAIFDGGDEDQIINIIGASGILLKNLKLTNGYASAGNSFHPQEFDNGGAIYARGSEVMLENVEIKDNRADESGGGLYLEYAEVEFDRVNISNNTAIRGSGIYISNDCSLTTDSICIYDNRADYGGGIFLDNSGCELSNLYIFENRANYNGGGIYCLSSDAVITGCEIFDNNSDYGAGIFMNESSPYIEDLLIRNNYANREGGGLHMSDSSPFIYDLKINDNHAGRSGGGIYLSNSGPVILDCKFIGNEVGSYYGGGIYSGGSEPALIDCLFEGCTAKYGGGMAIDGGTPVLSSVVVYDNEATSSGGGLFISGGANPFIFDGSVVDNGAQLGGGMFVGDESNPTLVNTRIVENTAGDGGGIYFSNLASVLFDPDDRCNLYGNRAHQTGMDLYSTGCEVITVVLDTFSVIYPVDQFANKVENFEFDIWHWLFDQGDFDVYVSPDGSDGNSGYSPDEPLLTIEKAFYAILFDTVKPYTVHLAPGVYSAAETGEEFPLHTGNNLDIRGAGKENTIIDGGREQIFIFEGNLDLRLSDLTLTNGEHHRGGAVSMSNSRTTFENVNVTNCKSTRGGGIYAAGNVVLKLLNTEISDCEAYFGGGIFGIDELSITGDGLSVIKDCHAITYGGGISLNECSAYIRNLKITGNYGKYGGGLSCIESQVRTNNLMVCNNSAVSGGAFNLRTYSGVLLENTTAAGNMASASGGGIYGVYSTEIDIDKSIFWGNEGTELYVTNCYLSVVNSDIQGGADSVYIESQENLEWLEGNLNTNPLFLGSGECPMSLSANSPCIDVCYDYDPFSHKMYPCDLMGNCRCADGNNDGIKIIDMGAYEYQPTGEYDFTGAGELSRNEIIAGLGCYPNPVYNEGIINYQLSMGNYVRVVIFDGSGKIVKVLVDEYQAGGEHRMGFSSDGLTPGVYFVKLSAGNEVRTEKVLVF